MFGKVLAYVRRTLPEYEYNDGDFKVFQDADNSISLKWNSNFSVQMPTQEQLNSITQQEMTDNNKKVCCRCKITVVESASDILHKEEGSLALINGVLNVFYKGNWQEI